MSHIPTNAMPHAGSAEAQQEQGGLTEKIADQAAELVYNHPRKVAAAGAALAAGAVAAAAIPLVRGHSGSGKSDKKS